MRTTSHTPDLGETITLPVDSIQHQKTILILVTYMLLSILFIHVSHLSWNIVQHPNTHQQTMRIILVTIALKRYHPVWFASSPIQSPAPPIDRLIPHSDSYSLARVPPIPPPFFTLSTKYALTTSQLLLYPLIHDGTATRNTSATLNRKRPSLSPRQAKWHKTQSPYHNHRKIKKEKQQWNTR